MNINPYQNNNQNQNNQPPNNYYPNNSTGYNQYVQPPQQYPVNSGQKKKANKNAIIISVAAGVIILILLVTLIVLIANRNSGDTYNTYNTYVSAEYTEINNGLKDIEKEFYVNDKIPEDKIPVLFEKQEAYLKKQQDKGVIKFYKIEDDTIHIEFNPNEKGECDEPLDYYPGMYHDEIASEEATDPYKTSDIAKKLCSVQWLDLDTATSTFGEIQHFFSFSDDGKVTLSYSDEVTDKKVESTYKVNDDTVTFTVAIPDSESERDVDFSVKLIENSDLIEYCKTFSDGTSSHGFFINKKSADFSEKNTIKSFLDGTTWYSPYLFDELRIGQIIRFFNSDKESNSIEAEIAVMHGWFSVYGYSCSDDIAYFQFSSEDTGENITFYVEKTSDSKKVNAYITVCDINSYEETDYIKEQWNYTEW